MSEDKIHGLSDSLAEKRIEHAKLKRDKQNLAEIIKAENEIINLRREINKELQKISLETHPQLKTEE